MLKYLWKKNWKPDAYFKSFDEIPLSTLYRLGFRLILLDIDNTLMVHGQTAGNEQAKEKLKRVRDAGLEPILLSNAKRDRAAGVAVDLGCPVIGMAMKPSPKGVYEALKQTGFAKEETLLIGDQIFTDVWTGRRAGVVAVLVEPIDIEHEPPQIRLKRKLERFLFNKFHCYPTYGPFGSHEAVSKSGEKN